MLLASCGWLSPPPRKLSGHRYGVAEAHELVGREIVVDLRLLHAQDFGLGAFEPVTGEVEARANRVDVPDSDFHESPPQYRVHPLARGRAFSRAGGSQVSTGEDL